MSFSWVGEKAMAGWMGGDGAVGAEEGVPVPFLVGEGGRSPLEGNLASRFMQVRP